MLDKFIHNMSYWTEITKIAIVSVVRSMMHEQRCKSRNSALTTLLLNIATAYGSAAILATKQCDRCTMFAAVS